MRSPIEITIEDCERTIFDYIIIGSGAAGIATALTLAEHAPTNILIVERGPFIIADHIASSSFRYHPHLLKKFSEFNSFTADWIIDEKGTKMPEQQWAGVGGRTLFWGAHAPRFLPTDFKDWPFGMDDLTQAYTWAEEKLHISTDFFKNRTQINLLSQFQEKGLSVLPSPLAVENKTPRKSTLPHLIASSISNLLESPHLNVDPNKEGIHLISNAEVKKLCFKEGHITEIILLDKLTNTETRIKAHKYVLAAGALNSTKLVMQSNLPVNQTNLGHCISEHLFLKGLIELPAPLKEPVFMYATPSPDQPFMFELLGPFNWTWYDANNASIWLNWQEKTQYLLFYGFGISEIQYQNHLVLSNDKAGYSVHYRFSEQDNQTFQRMENHAHTLAHAMGGKVVKSERQPPGRSLHERGGLAMADRSSLGTTNKRGQFFDFSNLYCTDAAIWPSHGAPNPCLTITAVARYLAKNLNS